MTLVCPSCEAQYNIDESRIPAAGLSMRCPRCGTTFLATRQGTGAVPLPPGGAPAPAPSAAPQNRAVPLPAAGGGLPPAAPPPIPAQRARTTGPVPLPGAFDAPTEIVAPQDSGVVSLPGGGTAPAVAGAAPAGASGIEDWSPFGDEAPAGPDAPAAEADASSYGIGVPAHLKVGNPAAMAAPPMIDLSTDLGLVIPPPEPPPRLSPHDRAPAPAPASPPARPPSAPTPDAPTAPRPEDGSVPIVPPRLDREDRGGRRWQIKRRSGKVFGPFDQEKILKMLGEGELLGNEDVRTEGGDWQSMSEVRAFADALASAPGRAPSPEIQPATRQPSTPPAPMPTDVAPIAPAMYGGRIAASALVEVVDWRPRLRRLIPLALGLVVLLIVLSIGLFLGSTPLGYFGVYKIFGPPRVRSSSPAGALVAQARKGISQGTYRALGDAYRDAERAQQSSPKAVEPPALMVQAAGALQQQYGEDPTKLQRSRTVFATIEPYGKREPEVIRAQARLSLPQSAATARTDLEALLRREQNSVEDLYLLALSHAATDKARERSTLKLMLQADPHSGKAYYQLGDLAEESGDLDEAAQDFEKSKEVDATQDRATLRRLSIGLKRDEKVADAEHALRELIDAGDKTTLSPSEKSTAQALLGAALLKEGKPQEAEAAFQAAMKLDPTNATAELNYGRFLFAKRRFKEALDLLTPAGGLHRQSVDLIEALAEVQVALGHYEDATKVLAPIYATHQNDSRLATLQGITQASMGKSEEAQKLLAAALKGDPNSVEARLAMGRLHQTAGDVAAAKVEFQLAVDHAPQSARAHAGFGQFLLQTKDLNGAGVELTRAVQLDDENAEAHGALGQLALLQGQKSVARTQLLKAEALDPRQPGLKITLGTLLLQLGEYEAARARFEYLVNASPEDYLAQIRLGEALLAESKTDDALATFHQAQQYVASSSELNAQLALALLKKGEGPQAVLEAKLGIEADPKDSDAWLAQGIVQQQVGDFIDAKKSLLKAIELRPVFPDAWEQLGNTLVVLGEIRAAIGAYRKSVEQDPSRQRLALTIGDLQVRIKDYTGALATYLEAIKRDPKLVSAYYLVARAYDLAGKSSEAVKYYEKATVLDPQNAMPYKYLGYYYKGLGRNARAMSAFQAYLKRKPDADDKDVVQEEMGYLKGE